MTSGRTSSCWRSWPSCGPTTRCCPRRRSTTRCACERSRVWVIDPLDGTREFSELGPRRLGGARRAGRRRCGAAGRRRHPVARRDLRRHAGRRSSPHTGAPRILISRSRPPAEAELVAAALGGHAGADGFGGGQDRCPAPWRGRAVPPLGRTVRVGPRCASGRGDRVGPARVPHRRLTIRVQQPQPVPARRAHRSSPTWPADAALDSLISRRRSSLTPTIGAGDPVAQMDRW